MDEGQVIALWVTLPFAAVACILIGIRTQDDRWFNGTALFVHVFIAISIVEFLRETT